MEDEVDEDELLLARLDAGLFQLQQTAAIFAHLWGTQDAGLRKARQCDVARPGMHVWLTP